MNEAGTDTPCRSTFYLDRVECLWTEDGLPQADLFRADDLEPAPPGDE